MFVFLDSEVHMEENKTLKKLYKYIDEQQIKLKYVNDLEYNYNLCGLYAYTEDTPVILLDSKLEKDTKKHVSVLAEECGHYVTSYGNSIEPTKGINDAIEVNKTELKADKWKCQFIIPEQELKNKLLKCNSLLEVASSLDIDVEIVLNRLIYLSRQSYVYWLSDNTCIDLTSLPNLHKVDINNK